MTSDQETRVLAMLSAFEAGKKISELDTASGSVSDMRIEVLDTDGESKVMNLSEAVTTAANAVCGRYWNESNSTYRPRYAPQAARAVGTWLLPRSG